MSKKPQTILASRPAAMVLALSLVGGLTAPFIALPLVYAAPSAPPQPKCIVDNTNGCIELSPTPPEDTVAVPANIVLMLDDSGSMSSDYMPDKGWLTWSSNALINAANNGTYYNPTVPYSPPPQADGSLYATYTDITSVPADGFNPGENKDLTNYSESYNYSNSRKVTSYSTQTYDDYQSSESKCKKTYNNNDGFGGYSYKSHSGWWQLNGDWHNGGGECTFTYKVNSTSTFRYFQYATGPVSDPVIHYVAPASQGCGDLNATTTPDCVLDTSPSGLKDSNKNDISIGQNVANWFAYDHTRMLLAKTGLMTAFDKLNPSYRFGFASINANGVRNIPSSPTPFTFDDYTPSGGSTNNKLAVVQPFGAAMIPDPSDPTGKTLMQNPNSQRYKFWNWIANESPGGNTPLRKALKGAGEYYRTSSQPWETMQGDPGWTKGSTTQFACRASYTILTTDGFWNGQSPSFSNIDGQDGPDNRPVPPKAIAQYKAVPPYSDSVSDTLADVAMYYWANDLSNMPNEVAGSKTDPATWQHMTTFTMGLGFTPTGITGKAPNGNNPPTIQDIFNWANDGGGTGSPFAISGFSWPTPSSNSINNIADLAHAAVNGHGDFFSVKSPQDLATGFAKAIAEINARTTTSPAASVNASVVAVGAIGFQTSYNTGDWSGTFQAVALEEPNAKPGDPMWTPSPNALLDSSYHLATGTINRPVYTVSYNPANTAPFTSFKFTPTATGFDASEKAGLLSPALTGGNDTQANRINYLLGSSQYEGTPYRTRSSGLLGAIIHAQPVYVGYPSGNYFSFPAGTDEAKAAAASSGTDDKSYDAFVTRHAKRAPTVYLGANDGMLHAFNAPVPQCTSYNVTTQKCASYNAGSNPGAEDWAFIPRAVYANLGNLTTADMQFRPTVDATPVTRDVFFGGVWHTLLAGGVGLGGRGVYALDISGAANSSAQPTQPNVLWEFDADMTASVSGCKSNVGTCAATDLGFTVSQPNIGRLANGKWVVLVPNGYFPDCTTPDFPTADNASCNAIANQAPGWSNGAPYSALFVLDAQTGAVIAELKTPQISGVTSFGLATPVMGDYNNDQIDDVAFAGDAMGNLWRFDFSDSTPGNWKVTLAYKGGTSVDPNTNAKVVQPITAMPRLFPDPTTNRFMVVFGTGRFLGVGDNSNKDVQALYGVRDQGSSATSAMAYVQSNLVQQYLHETVVPANAKLPNGDPDPNAGATLRCVTGSSGGSCDSSASGGSPSPPNTVPASKAGWYINLKTTTSDGTQNDAGERVVVNPGAIFASNTVVFETLITGAQNSDPCSPTTVGSIMALNALTGGTSGVSSLGGGNIVGGRINNARTSGSLPLVSALGGGQVYLPGTALAPNGTNPLSIDAPIWRRRSWSEIKQN